MDKSRQQFEEEFMKHSMLDATDIFRIDIETGDYYYLTTRQAWLWWQASRESLEIELPNVSGVQHTNYDCGYRDAIDKCEIILISNGVKIKNEQ